MAERSHAKRLAILNETRKPFCFAELNDAGSRIGYNAAMHRNRRNWYFAEWLRYFGKKQADVVRELDWNKAKVSLLASGKQAFMRDDVFEIAEYLSLHPFELLMSPDDAMALRALRSDAMKVVKNTKSLSTVVDILRDGTHG